MTHETAQPDAVWHGLLTLLSASLLACSGSQDAQSNDEALTEAAAIPPGTYVLHDGDSGRLSLLVLLDDLTSYREEPSTPQCADADCEPFGLFELYSWGRLEGFDYLRFYEDDGTFKESYAFTVEGDGLRLRKSKTHDWFEMVRAPEAWCENEDYCQQQAAPNAPECGSGAAWSCEHYTCKSKCE